MTDNLDVSDLISKELAATESELEQLHHKVLAMEAKRDRFRTALEVVQKFQDNKSRQLRKRMSTNAAARGGGQQFFSRDGHTAQLVRYLHDKEAGSPVKEASVGTGVSTRTTWQTFDRLCKSGMLHRAGNEYSLTAKGIAIWQESPLFEASQLRNGTR